MITKEQAEQAFHARYDHPGIEIRNLLMDEVEEIDLYDVEDYLGQFDIETHAWRCIFERRHKRMSMGKWTGYYTEWQPDRCFIVEPKPGPYVIG